MVKLYGEFVRCIIMNHGFLPVISMAKTSMLYSNMFLFTKVEVHTRKYLF